MNTEISAQSLAERAMRKWNRTHAHMRWRYEPVWHILNKTTPLTSSDREILLHFVTASRGRLYNTIYIWDTIYSPVTTRTQVINLIQYK